MTNITVKYLLPNCTSVLQPLDAGIIKNFKCFYKNQLIASFLRQIELNGKYELPDLKQAIYMVENAWSCVTRETISNCWKHCNIIGTDKDAGLRIAAENECHIQVLETNLKKFKNLSDFAYTAKEYLESDDAITTGEILTTDDIIAVVVPNDEKKLDIDDDDDDEACESEAIITHSEAFKCIKNLKLFFEQNKFSLDDIKLISNLDEKIKDFSITHLKQQQLDNYVVRKLKF